MTDGIVKASFLPLYNNRTLSVLDCSAVYVYSICPHPIVDLATPFSDLLRDRIPFPLYLFSPNLEAVSSLYVDITVLSMI